MPVLCTKPARATYPQHIHYARVRVTAVGATFDALGYPFDAKLPAGANIVGIHANKIVTFSGGTPVISVGRTGAATEIHAAILPIVAGKVLDQPVAGFAMPTADYEARVFVTGGATAGDGEFTIMYVPTTL